jgi:hypothetical protein
VTGGTVTSIAINTNSDNSISVDFDTVSGLTSLTFVGDPATLYFANRSVWAGPYVIPIPFA